MAEPTIIEYVPARRKAKPKPKPKNYLPWIIGGAAVAVGGYLLVRHLSKPKAPAMPSAAAGGSNSNAGGGYLAPPAGDALPLRVGSSGPKVQQLQQLLTQQGYDTKGVDGQFGTNTQTAVMAFQRAKGLNADGVVGDLTWNALQAGGGATSSSNAAPSQDSLAKQLFKSWLQADGATTLSLLKRIPNAESYRATSTEFGQITEAVSMVTRTLVTALSERFGSTSYWTQMQTEFRRMGLVYRDNKWYFPGLNGPKTQLLVTSKETPVMYLSIDGLQTARSVPANTPLGDYQDTWQWKGHTLLRFRTADGKLRYVPQSHTRFAA